MTVFRSVKCSCSRPACDHWIVRPHLTKVQAKWVVKFLNAVEKKVDEKYGVFEDADRTECEGA